MSLVIKKVMKMKVFKIVVKIAVINQNKVQVNQIPNNLEN